MLLKVVNKIKRKLLKKKGTNIRRTLKISQFNHVVTIQGDLSSEQHSVQKLFIQNRENEEYIELENELFQNKFKFNIDLEQYGNVFNGEKNFDFYLYLKVKADQLSERKTEKLSEKSQIYIDENNEKFFLYTVRLGRFLETETSTLSKVNIDGNSMLLYKTVKGNISLAINKELNQEILTQINQLKYSSKDLYIKGKLFTRSHDIENIHLTVIGRHTNATYTFPANANYLE